MFSFVSLFILLCFSLICFFYFFFIFRVLNQLSKTHKDYSILTKEEIEYFEERRRSWPDIEGIKTQTKKQKRRQVVRWEGGGGEPH